MATSASFTNHFLSLALVYALLHWLIVRFASDSIERDLFAPDLPHASLPESVLQWEQSGKYLPIPGVGDVFVREVPFAGDKSGNEPTSVRSCPSPFAHFGFSAPTQLTPGHYA
jgi:hypothetical protein